MNIQEVAKSGLYFRRAAWKNGEFIKITPAGRDYAQMWFVYPCDNGSRYTFVHWSPSHLDLIADDWEDGIFSHESKSPPIE